MRFTIVLFALVLVAMQLELWFADDRRPGLERLKSEVEAQSALNQSLAERNADLVAELISLRDDRDAVEERARAELGLVLPDETFYQIVEAEQPREAGTEVSLAP